MVTKTCKNCGGAFQCGSGTKKSVTDKFCGMRCAEDYYKDCEELPPPSGCRL